MFIISIISYIKSNVNKILHIYIKRLPFAEVFFTYVYSPVKCTTVAVCPTAFKNLSKTSVVFILRLDVFTHG
jgi:hypothetical protein